MRKRISWLAAIVLMTGLFASSLPMARAVSTTTIAMNLQVGSTEGEVDGQKVELPLAPTSVTNTVYDVFVPIKAVGEALGVPVQWNGTTGRVEWQVPHALVEFDLGAATFRVNGKTLPFDGTAHVQNERLMVKLKWLCDYIGAKLTYDGATGAISVRYTPEPLGVSDSESASRPVAKFTFTKRSYKRGEPITYVDLSYSPDSRGLVNYEWEGKQDTFFDIGVHTVRLRVTDSAGRVSAWYSRDIVIESETYLNPIPYQIYYSPPGSTIDMTWSLANYYFMGLPQVEKQVRQDTDRKLLVSDSPETIDRFGLLYADKVNGKARLYADHINGTDGKMQLFIMATNRTDKPVTIRTTNKGEVYPSIYAQLIGHEASIDFMLHDPLDSKLVVPPGETMAYVSMPDFFPGQGVNLFYDVETDGELTFSFVAMDPSVGTPDSVEGLAKLPFHSNVRGTFPASDIYWTADLQGKTGPTRMIIGDGDTDPFLNGVDPMRPEQASVPNFGNYGVLYHIHVDHPGRVAVLLVDRGGPFEGPIKINGDILMVPSGAVLKPITQAALIMRTTGKEDALDIEFTPPAGSALPADLIFYPLEDGK